MYHMSEEVTVDTGKYLKVNVYKMSLKSQKKQNIAWNIWILYTI